MSVTSAGGSCQETSDIRMHSSPESCQEPTLPPATNPREQTLTLTPTLSSRYHAPCACSGDHPDRASLLRWGRGAVYG